MMTASYIGPEGFGNSRTGLKPWPAGLAEALQRGEVPDGAWAALFSASCPRFGRMDGLSRLGLMAVELLGVDFAAMPETERQDIGVCLETQYGCLAADQRFLGTLSPNVFTYTLPSTALGEICIRHRLRGPVLCLLETGQALAQAQTWLTAGEIEGCLCLCADVLGESAGRLVGQPASAQAGALWLTRAGGADARPLLEWCRELCISCRVSV